MRIVHDHDSPSPLRFPWHRRLRHRLRGSGVHRWTEVWVGNDQLGALVCMDCPMTLVTEHPGFSGMVDEWLERKARGLDAR